MSWAWGDSFDLYAAAADMTLGYWDSGVSTVNMSFSTAGRFTGSQKIQFSTTCSVTKSSGVNDAVHHLFVAFFQSSTITGSTLSGYLQLLDGTTAQCTIVFRSDGAILLASGGPTGTVLATYTSAFTAQNTWYAFEFEVVINNTTGSFAVRKNGNTSNDFSATSLDTQNSANAYANKLTFGSNGTTGHHFDDLFWRSDASSVAWMGDIRCYTRMPSSDISVQFSRVAPNTTQSPWSADATQAVANGTARYTTFTSNYNGTISTATVNLATGYTGNMKCSIFASSAGAPTTVLGSATPIANPISGVNTFTFGTPVTVTKGTVYWIGFDSDTSSGSYRTNVDGNGKSSATAYASFPVASPSTAAANQCVISVTIAITDNASAVGEAQQDGATTYVYSSTPGQADLYGLSGTGSTPSSVIATTLRGLAQKSDAGTRTLNINLRSGATTASASAALSSSAWGWIWRTDTTDPATGAAWTPTGVAGVQIGAQVTG